MSEETPKCEPNPVQQTSAQKMEGTILHCSFYGCKQTFTDVQKLTSHTQSHQIPTQSLPGKMFQCSALGCTSSFPNMQQLMEHMRRHYKPNHYFLCESCRSRLRSYRALFKHLHNCAKVARSKAAKVAEISPAANVTDAPEFPTVSDSALSDAPVAAGMGEPSAPPQNQVEESEMKSESNSLPVDSVPAAAAPAVSGLQASVSSLPLDPSGAPSTGPFSLFEQSGFAAQPQNFPPQTDGTSGSFPAYLAPLHSSPPPSNPGQQEQQQEQQRILRGVASSPPASAAPPTPLGSNAVWRKNQDESGPVLHRRNSPCSSQSLSTGEFQASPSAIGSYGSTQGGAIDACSVATPPLPGRR
uniref:Zinc finger protein 414 n=1 Tax=Scleropages formosus TaxID=113540 RepID=A0A8C9V635_SCLFO